MWINLETIRTTFYLTIYTTLYFKNVQPRIEVMITHHALQK